MLHSESGKNETQKGYYCIEKRNPAEQETYQREHKTGNAKSIGLSRSYLILGLILRLILRLRTVLRLLRSLILRSLRLLRLVLGIVLFFHNIML